MCRPWSGLQLPGQRSLFYVSNCWLAQRRLIMLSKTLCRFETWGKKILTAVEEQGRLLSHLTEGGKNGLQQRPDQLSRLLDMDGDNLETMSRKDTPWTPITGSDMILSWSVFPQDRPVSTFPSSEYAEKPKPTNLGTWKRLCKQAVIL